MSRFMCVVGPTQAVEVEHQQGARLVAGARSMDPVMKEHAVRQAGDIVVKRACFSVWV
jgi:hypothetical protein